MHKRGSLTRHEQMIKANKHKHILKLYLSHTSQNEAEVNVHDVSLLVK